MQKTDSDDSYRRFNEDKNFEGGSDDPNPSEMAPLSLDSVNPSATAPRQQDDTISPINKESLLKMKCARIEFAVK